MAYSNFIPAVWTSTIERALEQACVMAEDCNREYEGEVKKCGDQVRILGIGSPTIRTIARANASDDILGPEEVQDNSVTMVIDQIRYYNYMVGDIDEAQSKPKGIMDALAAETTEKLAQQVDTSVAETVVDASIAKVNTTAVKVTEDNVLEMLDAAQQKLWENNVSTNTEIVVTVSPRFFTLFRRAYRALDTGNSQILKNGRVGVYNNMTVKLSNNVKKTQTSAAGDTDNIPVRTKRAVALAIPLIHSEAYRPEKKFADAVKGFILYGVKIVRPLEMVNLNVKY